MTTPYALTATKAVLYTDDDGVKWSVPADPDNKMRQAFDAWCAAGGVPAPYVPPPTRVPAGVSMAQARHALLEAGLLVAVNTAIDSMPEPQRSVAKIDWQFRATVERASTLVQHLGPAIGLDDAGLDALFIRAAAL